MNTPTAQPPAEVVHNAARHQFEITIDGGTALSAYHLQDGVLELHHTEVPAALGGRGLAALLVAATLAWAREQGLQVRPTCSYAAAYMAKRAETQDLLVR
jgi:predicted GNAT family acetyltransferase